MDYKYVIVTWPESQYVMQEEEAYLLNDNKAVEKFGSSAYIIREDIYKNIINSWISSDTHSVNH